MAGTLKIAFIVERFGYYKFYMPVIQEALRRGHSVSCWHDYGSPRTGAKDYLFPGLERVPEVIASSCTFDTYEGADALWALEKNRAPDFVVSLRPPSILFDGKPHRTTATFVTLQSGIDNFLYEQQADAGSDVHAVFSPYWLDLARQYFKALGQDRADRFEATYAARTCFAGYPGLEALRHVDRNETRARWNIPPGKPVLLIFPMPLFGNTDAWQRFYQGRSRIGQILEMIRRGDFSFWRYMLAGVSERAFAAAVREFAKRNDLFVLVKGRQKSPIDKDLESVADKVVYDEAEWPSTVFDAVGIADICLHFQSYAALEIAAAGCRSICIRHPDFETRGRLDIPFFFDPSEGHIFNYPGVSKWMEIDDAIEKLPEMRLSEIVVDGGALEAFKGKFFSATDGRTLLDQMERRPDSSGERLLANSEIAS